MVRGDGVGVEAGGGTPPGALRRGEGGRAGVRGRSLAGKGVDRADTPDAAVTAVIDVDEAGTTGGSSPGARPAEEAEDEEEEEEAAAAGAAAGDAASTSPDMLSTACTLRFVRVCDSLGCRRVARCPLGGLAAGDALSSAEGEGAAQQQAAPHHASREARSKAAVQGGSVESA